MVVLRDGLERVAGSLGPVCQLLVAPPPFLFDISVGGFQAVLRKSCMSSEITLKPYIHNGQSVQIPFLSDAFFNATVAARVFGKRPENWLRTAETKAYIEAVARKSVTEQNQLVKVVQGGSPNEQGTWLHPKLGISFARWLNPDFAVWADEQVEFILHGQPVSLPRSYAEALRLYADQVERNEQQQRELEASRPKIAFHDQVVGSETLIDFAELFSLLQRKTGQSFTRSSFMAFGRRHGFICQPNPHSGITKNRFVPRRDYTGTWFVSEMHVDGGTEWKVRPMAVAGIVALIEVERNRAPFAGQSAQEAA